jgi:hypothetical protein
MGRRRYTGRGSGNGSARPDAAAEEAAGRYSLPLGEFTVTRGERERMVRVSGDREAAPAISRRPKPAWWPGWRISWRANSQTRPDLCSN